MSAESEKKMLDAIHLHFGQEDDSLDSDYMPAVKIVAVFENSTNNALYRGTYQGISGKHESHVQPIIDALHGDGGWEDEPPVFDHEVTARPDLLL
jgi:hypothetical protein